MTKTWLTDRPKKLLLITAIIFLAVCSSGCYGGDTIEEEPSDPRLTGKVVQFDESMAYMLLTKKDVKHWDEKAVEIGREIIRRKDFEAPYSIFSEYPREDIRDDMTFTIISSYWVRLGPTKREYGTDIHMVILKDENGILSVCKIIKIADIETNILGELL